jgi:hypothetical protein
LQVHTGGLLPQLLQLRDRGIAFGFLLGSLGLAAGAVKLCC